MLSVRSRLAGVLGLLVLALLASLLLRAGPVPITPPTQGESAGPRLAVLVVFDQMRGDYLERWATLFGEGGFRRICFEGTWFQNCHYPYASTQTGPGHASLGTGCSADRHGIVANEWYEPSKPERDRVVYCVASDRARPVFPGRPASRVLTSSSPEHLLAPTLADSLKQATGGLGRVVALSLKDRSAVLPAGRKPDGCYWTDAQGQFGTSTFYRNRLPAWVVAFNQSGYANRWQGTSWERLRPDLDYQAWSGPDDVPGEGGRGLSRIFPHPLLGEGPAYYSTLFASPFGNDLLLEFTRKAIVAEELGKDSTPDLLCVSFSSNDLIGHAWGPDSQEVLDVTLRSDRIVRGLLEFLDRAVGRDQYVLALSADHGICPLPEVSRARGREAARIDPGPLVARAQEFLNQHFSPTAAKAPGPLIAKLLGGNLYLDEGQIRRRGLEKDAVADVLAGWLADQPGLERAFATHRFATAGAARDALEQRVRKSFYPGRSGDVVLIEKPYYLLGSALSGTNHGTPHDYDTHVPLVVYGKGVPAQQRRDPVTPQAAAVILAHALGVPAPAQAEAPLPPALFP